MYKLQVFTLTLCHHAKLNNVTVYRMLFHLKMTLFVDLGNLIVRKGCATVSLVLGWKTRMKERKTAAFIIKI